MPSTIRLETDPRGVARLTLARTDKHNALDAAMMDELTEAAQSLGSEPSVRVVVLAADGPTFCAGGDLAWMRAQMDADREARTREARRLATMLHALDTLPKPLVAQVQGPAYGGGVGLLSVCDIAVAADTATFAMTETRLGIIPATIGPYVLARIGAPAARRLMLPSKRFDAPEAQTLGLLARAVPPDALAQAIEEEIQALLACAPGAIADAKRLIRHLSNPISPEVIEHTIKALADRWETEEAGAGVRAFFDRRPPPWLAPEA